MLPLKKIKIEGLINQIFYFKKEEREIEKKTEKKKQTITLFILFKYQQNVCA